MSYAIVSLLLFVLLLSAVTVASSGETVNVPLLEVEAAPKDISITTVGPKRLVNYVDESVDGRADFIALFTGAFGTEVLVKRLWVAVQVNANNEVVRVLSPSSDGSMPAWEAEQQVAIPPGGYVLLAFDDSWATKDFRKFLAMNFVPGDLVKLRRDGEVIPVEALPKGAGPSPTIRLDNQIMYTEVESVTYLTGTVRNYRSGGHHRVVANEHEIPIAADGSFSFAYPLVPGTNTIDVEILQGDHSLDVKSLIVFHRQPAQAEQEVFLWVEQGPNARRFQTSQSIYDMLVEAKGAGITAIALDVKGIEGYAAYKKNDLTGRPYVSAMATLTRAGANPELDLLEEFIKHARALGLKVHASLNAFSEGSIAHNAFAILNRHLDWEEIVYRPEDNGMLLRLRESQYGRSSALVTFVNPANPAARDYQLRSFEEVIKNYDVDGVIVDRGRYDNYFADFSEISREQFAAYLLERGKELQNWPDDVYVFRGNARVDGPLINEWYTFRASVIRDFISDLRTLVDEYNEAEDRNVLLSAYVGSWYETYYVNGANWASKNFVYDPLLRFPQESVYTDAYRETSYLDNLDFLMIGTYQSTADEVRRYITLANIVTNGDVPLYAGMALANVKDPKVQREAFQAGLSLTDGLMIFDLTQANFPMLKASIDGSEFIKDYQLGLSNPRDPSDFIAVDFLNVNRNEADINVYTEAYGLSTNTSTWGVEVIVDPAGRVTRVVNKVQAMSWVWSGVQANNSPIPVGGFVVSAEDPSGQRRNRQLIANAFRVGDQVRAALLGGIANLTGQEITSDRMELVGYVEVIGTGTAEVAVNDVLVPMDAEGKFAATVRLEEGFNQIEVRVWVDGHLTNHQSVAVTRVPTD